MRRAVCVAAALALLVVLAVGGPASAGRPAFQPAVLQGLSSGQSSAADVNGVGEIVGWSTAASGHARPVVWRDRTPTELPLRAGDTDGYATAISPDGLIVGVSGERPGDPTETAHAVLWRDGALTDLGTLPGGTDSTASDVNDAGQVVGCARTTERGGLSHVFRGFLWQAGQMTILPPLEGETDTLSTMSCARSINERGEIVGFSAVYQVPTDEEAWRAVAWEDAVPVDLGSLVGDPHSSANGISAAGQVVGTSGSFYPEPELRHAVLWTGAHIHRLASPEGAYWTIAVGINARGIVVGQYAGPQGMYGCVWRGATLTDLLPPAGADASGAVAVNDAGLAVGWGGDDAVTWEIGR